MLKPMREYIPELISKVPEIKVFTNPEKIICFSGFNESLRNGADFKYSNRTFVTIKKNKTVPQIFNIPLTDSDIISVKFISILPSLGGKLCRARRLRRAVDGGLRNLNINLIITPVIIAEIN